MIHSLKETAVQSLYSVLKIIFIDSSGHQRKRGVFFCAIEVNQQSLVI